MARGKNIDPITGRLIKSYADDGEGPTQIGKRLGLNRQTVHRFLARVNSEAGEQSDADK